MKSRIFLVGSLLLAWSPAAHAQSASPYTLERGYPTSETADRARDDADFQHAITAYRFWYPSVSVEGIFNGNRELGIKDGEARGIAAAGPRQVGFTLNSDTPYGSGVLDVSNRPMVIDLPPGPFIGLVNDHYQSWVLDMGLPGPDAGKGGKHLVLPPGYKGEVPNGYHVGRTTSNKNLFAIRALPVGGDIAKAMDALRAVKVYPFGGDANLKVVDTTEQSMDSTSLRWEDNIQFWEKLARIVNDEPLVPTYQPMYGLLAELGISKGTPFAPDARMKDILVRAAKAGRDQLLVSAFDSKRSDRIAWPGLHWEWLGLVPNSAQFDTPEGIIDLEARDRWFAQAIVTSPAMFSRVPGAGSLYWGAYRDATGTFLDGSKTYRLTVPQPVPARLFWSVTAYDTQTRSEVQTDQDKAALRSLFELKDVKGSEPVNLYFGPNAPQGQESRWIKTQPGRGWFAYIRIYGPEQAAFDRSWKPSDLEEDAATVGSTK